MYLLPLILLSYFALPAESACPAGFEEVSNMCFAFLNKELYIWDGARQVCQNLVEGADLAVFNDCSEFDHVIKYILANAQLQVPPGYSFWIGGNDRGEEGQWYWVTLNLMPVGVPFWGTNKAAAEPSGAEEQNCAMMYRDDRYYVHDGKCEQLASPMCRVDPI